MKRIAGIVILALLALSCAGCFDYTENMVINDDGSGTLSMHIAMDKSYLKAMDKMAKDMAAAFGTDTTEMESPTSGFSRANIEQSLADNGGGVTLVSIDSSETEDAMIWDMKFAFDDIGRAYAAMAALDNEEDGDMYGDDTAVEAEADESEPEIVWVKQADGTWLFERNFDNESGMGAGMDDEYGGETEIEEVTRDDSDDEAVEDDAGEMSEDEADDSDDVDMDDFEDEMAAMMGDLGKHKMTFSVTFPGEIVESNATSVDGRTATWELKLSDMDKAMKGMRAVIKK